jgi:hypothetical protein
MPASTSVERYGGLRAQLQGQRENAITKICDHKIADEDRFSVVTRMRRAAGYASRVLPCGPIKLDVMCM